MDKFPYKSLKIQDLVYIFEHLNLPIDPMWHQYVCMAFSSQKQRIGLFLDCGTGKTITSLLISLLWECKTILVVCPTSAFGAWERDLEMLGIEDYVFVEGTGPDRRRIMSGPQRIKIINYEGLKTVYARMVPSGEGTKRIWMMDHQMMDDYFDCMILDEIHRCWKHDSLQSQLCAYLATRRSDRVIGMSGTPVDENLLDLFNIMNIVDQGRALGTNFFAYRSANFYQAGFTWKEKDGRKESILNRISDTVIHFAQEECFDLPEISEIVLPIHPSKEFLEIQSNLAINKRLVARRDEFHVDTEKKNIGHTLLQLASGFFYYQTEDGVREAFRLSTNPKVDALLDLITDRPGEKIIVFYHHDEERDMISESLDRKKVRYLILQGGMGKELRATGNKFQKNRGVRVLLVQKTIQEGYDAYAARIGVFFTPELSPKTRKQLIGRFRRKGQTRNTVVYDLCLEKSLEKKRLSNMEKRQSFVDDVMEYMSEFH